MKYICSTCLYYTEENDHCGWCRVMRDWCQNDDYPCRNYYQIPNEKTA